MGSPLLKRGGRGDLNRDYTVPMNTGKTVNWDEVYSRLEAARVSAEITEPSADEKRKVLRKRAVDIAAEPPEKDSPAESIEIVEFTLSNERYSFETRHVSKVFPLSEITPLPCTPAFVYGIVYVKGEIISVIDIRKLFDLPERGISDKNKIIILHSDKMEFGVLADSVVGVYRIAHNEIEPSLPTLTGIREEYLTGVTKDRVVILDGAKLLNDRKIKVHDEV